MRTAMRIAIVIAFVFAVVTCAALPAEASLSCHVDPLWELCIDGCSAEYGACYMLAIRDHRYTEEEVSVCNSAWYACEAACGPRTYICVWIY